MAGFACLLSAPFKSVPNPRPAYAILVCLETPTDAGFVSLDSKDAFATVGVDERSVVRRLSYRNMGQHALAAARFQPTLVDVALKAMLLVRAPATSKAPRAVHEPRNTLFEPLSVVLD